MTQLRVAELDFDTIKTNLIEFMRSKPEFTDYDFTGSGLSVIMNLLAYNTHYNAVIANMLIQEVYLDTAVKPSSLALIAKRMGYTPVSSRAPKATLQIEVFPTDTPETLTLGKGAQFTAYVNANDQTTFVTRDAYTITPTNGRYIFTGVDVYEGASSTFRYVVDTTQQQKFEVPSASIDTSLLRVSVQESINSTTVTEYTRFDTLIDLDSTTLAYFVKMNENGNYEVYFGDNVFGKSVVSDQVVILDYLDTNGPVGNGANKFTFNDAIQGYTNILITTTTSAYGGANPETSESIRVNAQNTLFAQNRAITENDYKVLVSKYLPVESISVWGGETLTPAVYGKVFIAIKMPNTTEVLSGEAKLALVSKIKTQAPMGLVHEIVDPEYIYLTISTDVKYDSKKTTLGESTLITNITNALASWGAINLNKFSSTFEYSKLVSYIDTIDPAILGNDTNISFRKSITPIYGTNNTYSVNFYCDIKASNSVNTHIISTAFKTLDDTSKDIYITDNAGILYSYYILNSQKVILNSNIGTVDYTNGILTFNTTVVSATGDTITFKVDPNNLNTVQSRNNIITLQTSDINVTMKAV